VLRGTPEEAIAAVGRFSAETAKDILRANVASDAATKLSKLKQFFPSLAVEESQLSGAQLKCMYTYITKYTYMSIHLV